MIRRFLERSSPVKKIRVFNSIKSNRSLYCESKLELSACIMMEFDPNIVDFEAQPDSFVINKKRYTPDLRVVTIDGEESYIEVKPSYKLQDPKIAAKLEKVCEYFCSTNRVFKVLTEQNIAHGKQLENFTLLYRYLSVAIDAQALEVILSQYVSTETTWGDLRAKSRALGLPDYFPFQLLAYRHVRFDETNSIVDSMEVVW